MSRIRLTLVAATAAAALAALAAVGAVTASAHQGRAAATTVKVAMKEWGMPPVPTSAKGGKVTFVVRNVGKLDHEFVVLKTNRPAKALPLKGAKAVETGFLGRIAKFKPAQTRSLTLTLKPGNYVLICNLPAHYAAGQRASFRVS